MSGTSCSGCLWDASSYYHEARTSLLIYDHCESIASTNRDDASHPSLKSECHPHQSKNVRSIGQSIPSIIQSWTQINPNELAHWKCLTPRGPSLPKDSWHTCSSNLNLHPWGWLSPWTSCSSHSSRTWLRQSFNRPISYPSMHKHA
jgi:hypothetical protein